MIHSYLKLIFCWILLIPGEKGKDSQDYTQYHLQIIKAEKLIASENYKDALNLYEDLFEQYEFTFLRDYQRAIQLAYHLGDLQQTTDLMKRAILAGWTSKSIKKNKFLDSYRNSSYWESLIKDYNYLRIQYEAKLNGPLKEEVKKMFSKDQKKAMGALFKLSSKAQDRYAQNKFAPHSRGQINDLFEILESIGYPGEQIIGNDIWMSTILSHHNSISKEYVAQDTLYPSIKPALLNCLKKGQISPFEMALIDDWYLAVKSGWSTTIGYGILNTPSKETLEDFNALRKEVYLRPIELRNSLVEIENKTGMDMYLPGEPWVDGKIEILPDDR